VKRIGNEKMPNTVWINSGIGAIVLVLMGTLQKIVIGVQDKKVETACGEIKAMIDSLQKTKQDSSGCILQSGHFKADLGRIEGKVDNLDNKLDQLCVDFARRNGNAKRKDS